MDISRFLLPRLPKAIALAVALGLTGCGGASSPAVPGASGTPPATIPASPSPSASPLDIPPIPDGVYSKTVTTKDILEFDPQAPSYDLVGAVGHERLCLSNGHWGCEGDTDSGIFYLSDGLLVFRWLCCAAAGYEMYTRWKLKGNCLIIEPVRNNTNNPEALRGDQLVWEVKPFCKPGR